MKEGWEYRKLGEVCNIYQPKTLSSKELVEDGKYLVYGANGVIGKYNSYNHESSEVLMTCRGATCGTINVSKPYSWINGNAMVVHPQHNILSQNFLFYLLKGLDLSDVITGAAQPQITRQSLAPKKIAIPSLSEQQHIVEELDLLSSIIEKKKAQLNELDNLAQSLFYEMFGDPITNENGWEVKKLKEACTCITDGDHMPPPKVDKGIPFITISNIDKQNREIDFRDTFFVPQSYYDSINKERKAQIDDVLYTVTGSYGIPIIVKEDRNFCFQRHIALLRPNKHLVSPCYLCYWALCKSIKYLADDVATGIAQKTVGLSSLREFPIIIPPLSLQQQFASKIEAIEHQKELIQKSIKEVETLFNSRMDFYFN